MKKENKIKLHVVVKIKEEQGNYASIMGPPFVFEC